MSGVCVTESSACISSRFGAHVVPRLGVKAVKGCVGLKEIVERVVVGLETEIYNETQSIPGPSNVRRMGKLP
jgi:hypothetical protein